MRPEGRLTHSTSYRPLDRWLHWLALEPTAVRNMSFELERALSLRAAPAGIPCGRGDHPVYVCGLARSGTTTLLRLLDDCGAFRSLSYRDMPFVLAPNLWRRLSRSSRRNTTRVERPHGDGIFVDYDSPESFEEVFWRTFSRSACRNAASYGSGEVDDECLKAFADYRCIVADPRNGQRSAPPLRYLSKNNNNLVRLHVLAREPTAKILLAYRDPVATARSLHRLHTQFSKEADDAFTRQYMAWLGHHEFGPGHLPFGFARHRMRAGLIPEEPDYWLDYWTAVYRGVLDQPLDRTWLVHHDTLRALPRETLTAVFALLGTHADAARLAQQVNPPAPAADAGSEFNPEVLASARSLYARLRADPRNVHLDPQPFQSVHSA